MAKTGKTVQYTFTQAGKAHKLFCVEGDLTPFLNGLVRGAAQTAQNLTVTVGGFTRQRYPGGPAISVKGHQRKTIKGGSSTLRTLPGENATIEYVVGVGPLAKLKVLTFTFTGPFTALWDYAKANKKTSFVLRSPDGTAYEIVSSPPAGS